jgi:adenylyltransferase/sulfurtransferase
VGVLEPVCGTLGSLQALEAIKILTKIGDVLSNRILLVDSLSMNFRTIKLRNRQMTCAVCGTNPSIIYQPAPPPFDQCNNDQPCRKNLSSFIINVRPEHELLTGQFENFFHLPMNRLLYNQNDEQLRDELQTNIENNQQIVIVCRRGNDSQIAVRRLKELLSDIDNIDEKLKDLEGGFQAWHTDIDSSFPLY